MVCVVLTVVSLPRCLVVGYTDATLFRTVLYLADLDSVGQGVTHTYRIAFSSPPSPWQCWKRVADISAPLPAPETVSLDRERTIACTLRVLDMV